jgi:hypothetical protein
MFPSDKVGEDRCSEILGNSKQDERLPEVIDFGYVVQDLVLSQAYKPGTNETERKYGHLPTCS